MTEENTTREFWIQRPGVGEIVRGRLPECGPNDVVVRTLYSGISRGTESLVFRGEVPESSFEAMRCPFQEGVFPGPLKYGYISVGRVEAVGESGSPGAAGAVDESDASRPAGSLAGRTVFCLHPHQDRYVVPAAAVVPIPDGVPPERAVLAANLETAVNAVWDGGPSVGDRVVVIGAGVVGLLVAWLVRRIPGTEVLVLDVNPARGEAATALGLAFAHPAAHAGDADVVFHASGSADGLRTALDAAGAEAGIVELSWFGDQSVALPLGERFHHRRLTIRSSQVGTMPPERALRWSHRRRMELALDLLADDALDALITGESAFSELPSVMERLAESGEDTLCHRMRYD